MASENWKGPEHPYVLRVEVKSTEHGHTIGLEYDGKPPARVLEILEKRLTSALSDIADYEKNITVLKIYPPKTREDFEAQVPGWAQTLCGGWEGFAEQGCPDMPIVSFVRPLLEALADAS